MHFLKAMISRSVSTIFGVTSHTVSDHLPFHFCKMKVGEQFVPLSNAQLYSMDKAELYHQVCAMRRVIEYLRTANARRECMEQVALVIDSEDRKRDEVIIELAAEAKRMDQRIIHLCAVNRKLMTKIAEFTEDKKIMHADLLKLANENEQLRLALSNSNNNK